MAEWENKRISLDVALRLCDVSTTTFFRYMRDYQKNSPPSPFEGGKTGPDIGDEMDMPEVKENEGVERKPKSLVASLRSPI